MTKPFLRIPAAGWLGAVLLTFSFACVLWAMHLHAAEDTGNAPPPKASSAKAAGCYAFVDIEPGVAKLYPLQPGRVVKVSAHDNEVVEKDAVLLELDDTIAAADLARAQVALQVAQNDLEKAKFLPKEHAEKLAGQTAGVAAKKDELEAARNKRDQIVNQFKQQLGPKKEDAAAAEATVLAYEEAVKIEEAKLRGLQAYEPLVQRDIDSAGQQVKEKQALVRKAEFALKECKLLAPAKGTVLRVLVTEGDVLGPTPREPAIVFCPAKDRIVRAEIEQEFAGHLFLGQTAVIRDDSTHSPLYYGKVTRISDWFSHRRSMVQEPLQFNDVRTLECIITLNAGDKAAALRIGQRVRVTLDTDSK